MEVQAFGCTLHKLSPFAGPQCARAPKTFKAQSMCRAFLMLGGHVATKVQGGKGGDSAALQVGLFHCSLLLSLSLGGVQIESWMLQGLFTMPPKRKKLARAL